MVGVSSLNRASVSLSEIVNSGQNLKAGFFNIKARTARDLIAGLGVPVKPMQDMASSCSYPKRFKRAYSSDGYGFLGSSEMLAMRPDPIKFMPWQAEIETKVGQILISRSGTVGNVTYVSETLSKYLVSEHAIRLEVPENPGYVYAFLKTECGRLLIEAGIHGAVVKQVEPDHIMSIPVPLASDGVVGDINDLVLESFSLRDLSNNIVDRAQDELLNALELPAQLSDICAPRDADCFSISLSDWGDRLDASFHAPHLKKIVDALDRKAEALLPLGDKSLTSQIFLPGRFKRIYVEGKYGTPFIGGKEIGNLDPRTKKRLSLQGHKERILDQLITEENEILVTRSGTIGKVALVPDFWSGWAVSEHLLRIRPKNELLAGYLYAWLSTDFGRALIRKHTYGAVIFEIDQHHLGDVPVPILQKSFMEKIGAMLLEANVLKSLAFQKEQDAIKRFQSEVLLLT